jgi:hypothetical protein
LPVCFGLACVFSSSCFFIGGQFESGIISVCPDLEFTLCGAAEIQRVAIPKLAGGH